jgi:hypothetical protein
MKIIITIFLISIVALSYAQADTGIFKKHYNLFNPTPKNLMREFATDRPDATESPYTVDAGHFQLETDLFKIERSESGGVTTINNFYSTTNIKIGITNVLDIQLVVSPIEVSTISNGIAKTKTSKLADVTLRAKQNLWGNDNGQTALAILPYINIPTKNDRKFSVGILIPFSVSLPHGWGFGTQVGANIAKGITGYSSHVNFLASANISHSLFKNFDFFAEGVVSKDGEWKTYEYFLDGGFVFVLSSTIHIDTGIFCGLKNTSATTYFLGLSFRL